MGLKMQLGYRKESMGISPYKNIREPISFIYSVMWEYSKTTVIWKATKGPVKSNHIGTPILDVPDSITVAISVVQATQYRAFLL